MTEQVVVGDVGGTNVRFGVAEQGAGGIVIHDFLKVGGDGFDGFEAAFAHYLASAPKGTAALPAVFALAGPPHEGVVKLTNRDWTVSAASIKAGFGAASVQLVNDFTAMARAVPEMQPEALELIRPGTPRPGAPVIVAGPGTGFGVATIFPGEVSGWTVLNGEGGHMGYAPVTDIEIALAQRLRAQHGYVSNELVCAGVGLVDVHRALCDIFGRTYAPVPPAKMLDLAAGGDDMFAELCAIRARGTMGAAGDLVLANGAFGGVVLAGGVSERLAPYLKLADALERFSSHGPRADFLASVPVHLMHSPEAPLIGAAALHLKDRR